MIQGLLGTSAGAGLKEGDRKFSINGVLEGSTPSLSPSPSSSTATNPSSSSSAAAASSENQNLRCPRCDSTNTKFCYYNNYNLTQPRHFCKTCRRYWTKGGALRNVPIGGGCRKSKNNIATSVGKSLSGAAGNLKITVPLDVGKSGFIGGIEHEIPLKSNNPNIWPCPQNSHILSLLRTSQNTPSNLNPFSHMNSELAIASAGLNARNNIWLDSPAQVPSIGMCSSFWGNNNSQPHQAQQNQENPQNSFILQGGVVHQNNGFQELYQKLKSSVNYNYPADHHAPPAVLSNLASSTSSSPTILESAPVTAVEYWNPSLSWSDLHLPTTDGAYR